MATIHSGGRAAMKSLDALDDAALAARAVRGDGPAFTELAQRHRALLSGATLWPVLGLTRDDLHQEALIGLLEACRAYQRERGEFSALAGACVRNRVRGAYRQSRQGKHRMLNDAYSIDLPDPRTPGADAARPSIADTLRARENDPVQVVEAREQLAEIAAALRALSPRHRAALASEGAATAKARWNARQRLQQLLDGGPTAWSARTDGRCYTDEQVNRALALVAQGSSLTAAAEAVGAGRTTVMRWVRKAA